MRALQQRPQVRDAARPRAGLRRRRSSRPATTRRWSRTEDGAYRLRRGVDASKDQSYFLFALTQDQLARAVFPVGDRPKDAVRDYAHQRQLPVASKPDSQEICFIPDHDYAGFVTQHSPQAAASSGAIVDESGRVLGRHAGIHRFTVGQRKGLGLAEFANRRADVCAVAQAAIATRLSSARRRRSSRRALTASGVNWIQGPPAAPRRACVQIRHRHQPAPATVRATGRRSRRGRLRRTADCGHPRPGRGFLRRRRGAWWRLDRQLATWIAQLASRQVMNTRRHEAPRRILLVTRAFFVAFVPS